MDVLLRLAGDMAIKSDRIRARFLRILESNLRRAVADIPGAADGVRVASDWSRVHGSIQDHVDAEEVIARWCRVFGISSVSRVLGRTEADLPAIVAAGLDHYRERVRGRSFAVRCHRSGERQAFRSIDVNQALGAALRPWARAVDLTHPECLVELEVRAGQAFFLGERQRGAGGFPIGSGGKALVLFSGGVDSPVAAWRVAKRGIHLDLLFCQLAGAEHLAGVRRVAETFVGRWFPGLRVHLHIVDFLPLAEDIRANVKPAYAQVVLKRLFYRAANLLAREQGSLAIVTGEALAQVSSQTLANLVAIDDASDIPVLRPLIGYDKAEIMDASREIGTLADSSMIAEVCELVRERPVTSTDVKRLREQESYVNIGRIAELVAARTTWTLGAQRPADLRRAAAVAGAPTEQRPVAPPAQSSTAGEQNGAATSASVASQEPSAHDLSAIPADAVVLDIRDADAFAKSHFPKSQNVEAHELITDAVALDKQAHYVVLCEQGVRSAYVAEVLRQRGYLVQNLRGGFAAAPPKSVGGETSAASTTAISADVSPALPAAAAILAISADRKIAHLLQPNEFR